MAYYYSMQTVGWYDTDFFDYVLPEDAFELTLEQWLFLRERMNTGYVLGLNSEGMLEWQDPPPPTPEQVLVSQSALLVRLKNEAESQKQALTSRISTLQDAIDNIGIEGMEEFAATPEEVAELPKRKTQLTKWKNYAILLGRVTTQVGWTPDVIWPTKPSEGMDLTTNSATTPDTV